MPNTLAASQPDLARQIADIQRVFSLQKAHQFMVRQTDAGTRRRKLDRLKSWILSHRPEIQQALFLDFRKAPAEVDLTEIFSTKKEIDFAQRHLAGWMKPRVAGTPLALAGTRSWVVCEPKGLSLILAPWNYPFYLVISPLVSAIAAGCTAIIKPSELAPHTATLLRKMISELFQEEEVAVFEGDEHTAAALLKLPVNHIFFTGSTGVGKLVMRAAAEHLASVTLELGGKSPVLVDETVDLKEAARKIVWGKFLNAGQTCVAPDYILVQENVQEALVKELRAAIARQYGGDRTAIAASPDYARIINHRHYERLSRLLDSALAGGAQIAAGGDVQPAERYMAPTLLTDVEDEMEVMQQEIFGPILPLLSFQRWEEAVAFVNKRDKPLALYVFSNQSANIDYVINHTSSGGVGINNCVLHLANPNLPFGGVNHSGVGSSHGYYGFLAFSHQKAVLRQYRGVKLNERLFPPYTATVHRLIDLLMKYL